MKNGKSSPLNLSTPAPKKHAGPDASARISSIPWYGHVILLGVFICVFAGVLWLVHHNTYKTKVNELVNHAEALGGSIRLRLDGNMDYLLMLAHDRAEGTLVSSMFQERASRFVADHPEMMNITWVDSAFVILEAAPWEPNKQILGMCLELPEPVRASYLAKKSRQPVYTRPFEAIQGRPSFEIWVPVFKGDLFLGLFAGAYSCDKTLNTLVPAGVVRTNHVSLADAKGDQLAELPPSGAIDSELSHQVLLTPPESGLSLKFEGYGLGAIGWVLRVLELFCLVFAIGIAYAMWSLKREATVRKLAEQNVRKTHEYLQRLISSANVMIVGLDAGGHVRMFNDAAERITGYSLTELKDIDWFEKIVPKDRYENAWGVFQRYQQKSGEIPTELENPILTKAGEEKVISWRNSTINSPDGTISTVSFGIDVSERRRAELALSRREAELKEAQRIGRLGNWSWDAKSDVIDWSEEYYHLYGLDLTQRPPGYEEHLKAYTSESAARLDAAVKKSMTTGEPYVVDLELAQADAPCRWITARGETRRDDSGRIIGLRGTAHDITERKEAEEALAHLNRELHAISNCNQVLMHADDEQVLLNEICNIVCNEAGYRLAWVGFAEHDEAKTVTPVAWAGVEDGYLAFADMTWADTDRGHGPAGTAIRTGQSACVQDFATDLSANPWREHASLLGYRSSIALPLRDEKGTVFGVLNICSSEPNAFTSDEIRLLEELAGDLAFGISALRTRAARQHAEEELRKSEHLWRAVFGAAKDAVLLLDDEFNITASNDAAEAMYGWSLAGLNLRDLRPAEMRVQIDEQMYRAGVENGGLWETHHLRADGTAFPVEVSIRPFKSDTRTQFVEIVRDITERKRAEEDLRKSEERFRQTLESMLEGAMLIDRDWRYLYVNEAAARHGHGRREDLIGHTLLEMYPGVEQSEIFARYRHCMIDRMPQRFESSFKFADGTTDWYEFCVQPATEGIFVLSIDISARKRAEDAQARLTRSLRAVTACNEILIRAEDEPDLLNEICRLVCEEAGYRMAWVGYAEHDPVKNLRPVAWAGFESGYIADARISWDEKSERGQGPSGTAIRSGKAVHIQDFLTDPSMAPWRESALEHGYRSSIALPLKDTESRTFGTLNIYSTEPNSFTPDEIRLLEELAADLGFGITAIRTRVERTRAGAALRQSEEKYRTIFEESFDGLFIASPAGRILDMNKKGIAMFGYDTKDEVLSLDLEKDVYAYPSDQERVLAMVDAQGTAEYEVVVKKKAGDHIITHCALTPVRNAAGVVTSYRGVIRDITEQKRSEEALRDSEERYKLLLDSVTDYIYLVQIENGRPAATVHGPGCVAVTGYRPMDYAVDHGLWLRMVHEDDRPAVKDQIARLIAGEKVGPLEHRIKHRDGSLRWVRHTPVPRYDQQRRLMAYDGIVEDITERKRAEEELRDAHQLLETIFNHTHMMVAYLDRRFNFISVNPAYAKADEHESEYYTGKNHFDLYPNADNEAIFRNVVRTGEPYTAVARPFEYAQHLERGTTYWDWTLVPIKDANGDVTGLILTLLNVTGRLWAEQALRESEAKMRSIVNNVGLGVALISPRMEILELNQRMRDWFPDVELAQHPICYRAFNSPPRDDLCEYCPTVKTLTDGLVHESLTQTPRGSETANYRVVSSPILNANNEVTGAIELVEDITERLSLESQLRHAQKMESIGRLAGGVAHDFNNMLGAILGHAELVMAQLDPSQPIYADLQEIQKAAERSAGLTRQLLAFARRQVVAPRVLDLNETVDGMLNMLRRMIGEDIELVWRPASDVWPVKVDPTQIDQVLANLCVNSRDAIAGVGTITIETQAVTIDEAFCSDHPGYLPGKYVMLAVTDNGCGMDQETQKKLFEPFFTTKELGKGTGLGLATVYGIVKQNFGFIIVISEPGKGTTFRIYLPRHTGKVERVKKERKAAPTTGGKETILLAEDEPLILDLARRVLELFGYRVLSASTPEEAIRAAKRHAGEIQMLISDVIMPEMNGRDLAKNLTPLCPGLRCLFMSGYSADVIVRHDVLEEGVDFIQKPFSVDALAAKVREVLDRKEPAADEGAGV